MDKLFLTVLNMSLTGAFVIAAVILARLPLKKAPKLISYCLWAVAGFRLVFPFSIESIFSFLPFKAQPIPPDIATQAVPRIDSGLPFVNNAVSGVLPAATPTASVNPLQIWTAVGAYVWLIGVAVMLLYGIISYALLKRRMRTAIRVEGNLYETDNIQSPFVLGIIKPKIYLPLSLAAGEREYIILHERTHIRRHDHIIKFAAYFILCLHWFNPLAWVAFLLMGVDMEMSCDERVLKERGGETKHDYSRSLLALATKRRVIGGSPLAFSEGGLKQRIKNVLNFRKPSRVIITLAIALAAVLSVGFAVNRLNDADPPAEPPTIIVKAGDVDIEWVVGLNEWNGNIYDRLDNFQWLMDGKSIDDLVYVTNGETITIWFEDKNHFPMSPVLTEFILMENGNIKYRDDGMSYEHFTMINRNQPLGENYSTSMSFEVKPNYTTALSSYSGAYLPGNTIKGYRFVCSWEGNECEYAFIVRGDAAFTLEFEQPAPTTYEPTKWVDFYRDDELPWTTTFDLMLDEFPGVMFSWTSGIVTATDGKGSKELFTGMPIWNVYLADLNGDGLPELCATVSIGSGLIDTRVIVCDYANDIAFGLDDRGYYDYFLSIEDNKLIVTQSEYSNNDVRSTGTMAIMGGELVTFDLDRTLPETQESSPPHDPGYYTDPVQVVKAELETDGCVILNVFAVDWTTRQYALDGKEYEFVQIYAEYLDGPYSDAIYIMDYTLRRPADDNTAEWKHDEPVFWDGIAYGVAKYAAEQHYAETGRTNKITDMRPISIDDNTAYVPGDKRDWYTVVFNVGYENDPKSHPLQIAVLISKDGQSHWQVAYWSGITPLE